MTVLDASAILALIHDEPGADQVAAALAGALLGTVNLAEVVGKLVDSHTDASRVRALLSIAGVTIAPLLAEDAELAAVMRALDGALALSLGDGCCRALAVRSDPAEVLTAYRAGRRWSCRSACCCFVSSVRGKCRRCVDRRPSPRR